MFLVGAMPFESQVLSPRVIGPVAGLGQPGRLGDRMRQKVWELVLTKPSESLATLFASGRNVKHGLETGDFCVDVGQDS